MYETKDNLNVTQVDGFQSKNVHSFVNNGRLSHKRSSRNF